MLLAGANVLYLTLFDDVWALGAGGRRALVGQARRGIAGLSLGRRDLFGRMLPYIGNAF